MKKEKKKGNKKRKIQKKSNNNKKHLFFSFFSMEKHILFENSEKPSLYQLSQFFRVAGYLKLSNVEKTSFIAQEMKFSIKYFFSKYDQICRKLRI